MVTYSRKRMIKKATKLELQGVEKYKINRARVPKLDELLNDVYAICHPKLVDYRNRKDLVRIFNVIAKEVHGNSNGAPPVVEVFGSFVMDMFSAGSDLDLSVNFSNHETELPQERKIRTLRKFARKFYALQRAGHVHGIQVITSARVPIVKVIDQGTGIQCDLSIENRDGIVRSKIIHIVSEIDERFQKLCCLMKAWAKAHDINSSKSRTLNSLSIISIVALHLQTRDPPILPPFSALFKDGTHPAAVKNIVKSYLNYGKDNKESVAELFTTLFIKLASVEKLWCKGLCASLYEGSWISRTFGSMSIEDIIDKSENVARAVGPKGSKKIYSFIHQSLRELLLFLGGQVWGSRLRKSLFGLDSVPQTECLKRDLEKGTANLPIHEESRQAKKICLTWEETPTVNGWEGTPVATAWEGNPVAKAWDAIPLGKGWGGMQNGGSWTTVANGLGRKEDSGGWAGMQDAGESTTIAKGLGGKQDVGGWRGTQNAGGWVVDANVLATKKDAGGWARTQNASGSTTTVAKGWVGMQNGGAWTMVANGLGRKEDAGRWVGKQNACKSTTVRKGLGRKQDAVVSLGTQYAGGSTTKITKGWGGTQNSRGWGEKQDAGQGGTENSRGWEEKQDAGGQGGMQNSSGRENSQLNNNIVQTQLTGEWGGTWLAESWGATLLNEVSSGSWNKGWEGGKQLVKDQRGASFANGWGGGHQSDGWGKAQQTNAWGEKRLANGWGGRQQSDGWGQKQRTDAWGGKPLTNGWGGGRQSDGWGQKQRTNTWEEKPLGNGWGGRHQSDCRGQKQKTDGWGVKQSSHNEASSSSITAQVPQVANSSWSGILSSCVPSFQQPSATHQNFQGSNVSKELNRTAKQPRRRRFHEQGGQFRQNQMHRR